MKATKELTDAVRAYNRLYEQRYAPLRSAYEAALQAYDEDPEGPILEVEREVDRIEEETLKEVAMRFGMPMRDLWKAVDSLYWYEEQKQDEAA